MARNQIEADISEGNGMDDIEQFLDDPLRNPFDRAYFEDIDPDEIDGDIDQEEDEEEGD